MQCVEKGWPIVLLTTFMSLLIIGVMVKFVFFSFGSGSISIHEMMEGIPQNDTRLIEYIYSSHLHLPPLPLPMPTPIPLNKDAVASSHLTLTRDVLKILGGKRNGFFIECRAYDGDILSKTKELEYSYNWTGILLEPDPKLFHKLLLKRRNAWLLNGCISPDAIARNENFYEKIASTTSSSLAKHDADHKRNVETSTYPKHLWRWRRIKIPCFPLFTITSTLGVNKIDYLILDTQGLELQILVNVPWDSLVIKVISVNPRMVPEGADGVTEFLKGKGYKLITTTDDNFHTYAHT